MQPLLNIRLLTLAANLPGPLAAARLRQLGASVVKIEPPDGDPLASSQPSWYRALHDGQEVVRLNLKDAEDRARFDARLQDADLLLTSLRPMALQRLGMAWPELHARYPRLAQVAIVGYPDPHANAPGHDLDYQAGCGLLSPPDLPRALIADFAGAQETVNAGLALMLARERGQGCHYVVVSLAEAAASFAAPLRYGMTTPNGILGGGFPGYNLYRAADTWITIAALEPHFWRKLCTELDLISPSRQQLQEVFATRSAEQWETWAKEHDLPIVVVREASSCI